MTGAADDNKLKSEWRRRMKVVRDALSADERNWRSELLCRKLEEEVLQPLRTRLNRPAGVCLYASFRSEADPAKLLKYCREAGDELFAPRILPNEEGIELRKVEALSDWIAGRWGVPEPNSDRTVVWDGIRPLDIVLVPGLAFNLQGGRLGYGGGYYDRLYAKLRIIGREQQVWIGFAFGVQIVEAQLPIEPHDLRLDAIATEDGVRWIEGRRGAQLRTKRN